MRGRLSRSSPALPIDLFRVLVGLLSFAYYVSLLLDTPDFSSPHGLIDHGVIRELFWFTRLSLFRPGFEVWYFYVVFGLSCLLAWGIVLGYYVKVCAGILFVISVSTYRWNFIVMYVDDAVMHLVLFWLLLLPVGRTLVLREWLREGRTCLRRWRDVTVPSVSLYCFLANVCLVYLVAGLWKFESPLWRSGDALYVILNMPIAYTPEFWQLSYLPWLRVANYIALVVEPMLPVLLLLRPGHPGKWLGLILQLGFHVGILATLSIPFANLALLATPVLFFRQELVHALGTSADQPTLASSGQETPYSYVQRRLWQWGSRVAVGFIIVLTLSMTKRLPLVEHAYTPAAAVLWTMGIAQEYQLFNWIDRKNYVSQYTVEVMQPDGQHSRASANSLFPSSPRSLILQAYLYGVPWMPLPSAYRAELQRSLMERLAQRYCRLHPVRGRISVEASLRRVLPRQIREGDEHRQFIMSFQCAETGPVLCQTMLDPQMSCTWPPNARSGIATHY